MDNTIIKRQAKTHYLTEFPSIFRPIRRGAREKGVEIKYQYQNGSKVTIWMFKQLDIADQDLFLAIVSLIAEYQRGKIGRMDAENEETRNLREKLQLKDDLFELPILKMKVTIYKLLETMGRPDNKQTYNWCVSSLERLSRCGIGYDTDKYIGQTNLLSFQIDKATNEISIALNPVSASVFLNNDKYVLHNLHERFSLQFDVSKALQSYLNRMIAVGTKKAMYMDTIVQGVYGGGEMEGQQLRDGRRAIKKAIQELSSKKEYAFSRGQNGIIIISRRKIA